MGLYSLELWLLRLKKEKRELDVLPILGLLFFCLDWFGLGLFCFLLFLIVQTELICSQLWKIQGTMKTSASQDFHQAISVVWQHLLSVCGRGRGGQDGETGKASWCLWLGKFDLSPLKRGFIAQWYGVVPISPTSCNCKHCNFPGSR